jgi:CelD/BcsL family acetyltransferase involved in cellulose biosynthesis
LRLIVLREIPDDEDLRRQWNALADCMDRPQVFLTYEWSLAVQRAYRERLRPLIFLAYNDAGWLSGVAALATDAGERQVSFLAATTADYCDFVTSPEQKGAFVDAVLAELRKLQFDQIVMTNLPSDSGTASAIKQAAGKRHYRCFARQAYVCAQVSLAPLRRETGTNSSLPGKEKLRRLSKGMRRDEPVRLRHSRSWEEVAPQLDQFMLTHVGRFLVTQRVSNLVSGERRVFLSELTKLLSASGSLVLTCMMSREKAIAWNYGFQFHGCWFWYQPTFDSEMAKYSPGLCLLAKIVEEAAENPALTHVDLGLGAEEYKERFANQTRKTLHLTLQADLLGHLREMLRYRVATLVKTFPKVEADLRWLHPRVGELWECFRRPAGLLTIARRMVRNVADGLRRQSEVFFYESACSVQPDDGHLKLRSLDLNQLAAAATQYGDDAATLDYLLRSARRLSSKGCEGFALVDDRGRCLHFAWTTAFDGFLLPELNTKLSSPSPDRLMLFDCWTPASVRGRGYYGHAMELIAARQNASGKRIWIACPASNTSSRCGIEKTGFALRYSLVGYRTLWWQKVREDIAAPAAAAIEASVRL